MNLYYNTFYTKEFRNQTYMAVKIDQPTTFATFLYQAFDYSQSRWQVKDRSTIRVQLDGGTQDRWDRPFLENE